LAGKKRKFFIGSQQGAGFQMAKFQTKNTNLGKFLSLLQWKMLVNFMTILVYFTAIWYILWQSGIICGHLVFWYIFPMVACCTNKNLATLTA
jgi:hypothetical protein